MMLKPGVRLTWSLNPWATLLRSMSKMLNANLYTFTGVVLPPATVPW